MSEHDEQRYAWQAEAIEARTRFLNWLHLLASLPQTEAPPQTWTDEEILRREG